LRIVVFFLNVDKFSENLFVIDHLAFGHMLKGQRDRNMQYGERRTGKPTFELNVALFEREQSVVLTHTNAVACKAKRQDASA
jgi:hypothetical protein